MRDFVEAGFDVSLYDPLVIPGLEEAHLGHRVMGPAVGAEAAVFERGPQPVEELLNSLPDLDGHGGSPVHPGRAGTLVSPHPIPRHQQEGGIGDEVKQIVEPAMRIITSPTVQLGLDLQYPKLGAHQRRLQFVGIHRRQPPGIPVSVLLTCWPPSPCVPAFPDSNGGASRPRLLRGLRPLRGHRSATDLPTTALAGRWEGDHGGVPRSPHNRSVREVPSSTPAASPRLRRRHSPWPPHRWLYPASELTHRLPARVHALPTGPYPPGLSRLSAYGASTTGSLSLHLLTSLDEPAPSGSSGTSRRCQGCFPPSPAFPRSDCPQLRQTAATVQRRRSFTSTRFHGASWRT